MQDKIQKAAPLSCFFFILLLLGTLLLQSCSNNKNQSSPVKVEPLIDSSEMESEYIFIAPDSSFSVGFPDCPTLEIMKDHAELGTLTLTQYQYLKEDTLAWVLSYCDYPEALIKLGDSKKLLEGICQSIKKSHNAKLLNLDLINDVSIRFQLFSKKAGLHMLYKVLLFKNRLYKLAIYNTGDTSNHLIADRFYESFKILTPGSD